jgi:2-polyprenyl-6-methoxyphenol hydroxylase-like FAD-dependent oxidoreductase
MSVLVSGASFAGLSAAYWLAEIGEQVTVVERNPTVRRTGSPIDVRGDALGVAADMGILDAITANRAKTAHRTAFTTWVDAGGKPVGVLPAEAATDSADDIEILREHLVDIMHAALPSGVEFVHGDWIESVDDTGSAVEVTFAHGAPRRFDYLVGADGMHSGVRRLVFGPEVRYRHHLGAYMVIVPLPAGTGVATQSVMYNTPGRSYGISDFTDLVIGFLSFRSPEIEYDFHDVEEQKKIAIDALGDDPNWYVPMLMDQVRESEELFFDSLSQIRMPGWSRGRTVLVGDAAHATSPLSGRGTALAMLGGYFLAKELEAAEGDPERGFAGYEKRLRPYADRAQHGVPEALGFMLPATAEALAERNRRFPVDPRG